MRGGLSGGSGARMSYAEVVVLSDGRESMREVK